MNRHERRGKDEEPLTKEELEQLRKDEYNEMVPEIARNLIKRIDRLESDILGLKNQLDNNQSTIKERPKKDMLIGESQNLRDKEIIEFIGDDLTN